MGIKQKRNALLLSVSLLGGAWATFTAERGVAHEAGSCRPDQAEGDEVVSTIIEKFNTAYPPETTVTVTTISPPPIYRPKREELANQAVIECVFAARLGQVGLFSVQTPVDLQGIAYPPSTFIVTRDEVCGTQFKVSDLPGSRKVVDFLLSGPLGILAKPETFDSQEHGAAENFSQLIHTEDYDGGQPFDPSKRASIEDALLFIARTNFDLCHGSGVTNR